MRVDVISREYPPEVYGGAGVHVAELVRALRDDHDVRVRCFGAPRNEADTHAYLVPGALSSANPALATLGVDLAIADDGTVRVEHNNDFAGFIAPAAGFNTGVLWRNGLGNLSLEAKGDYFTNGEVRRSLSLNQQWELSRNLGLRLSARREFSQLATAQNEVMLEVKWYNY